MVTHFYSSTFEVNLLTKKVYAKHPCGTTLPQRGHSAKYGVLAQHIHQRWLLCCESCSSCSGLQSLSWRKCGDMQRQGAALCDLFWRHLHPSQGSQKHNAATLETSLQDSAETQPKKAVRSRPTGDTIRYGCIAPRDISSSSGPSPG